MATKNIYFEIDSELDKLLSGVLRHGRKLSRQQCQNLPNMILTSYVLFFFTVGTTKEKTNINWKIAKSVVGEWWPKGVKIGAPEKVNDQDAVISAYCGWVAGYERVSYTTHFKMIGHVK